MLRQLMRVPLSKPTQRLAGQLYPEDIHIYQFTTCLVVLVLQQGTTARPGTVVEVCWGVSQ